MNTRTEQEAAAGLILSKAFDEASEVVDTPINLARAIAFTCAIHIFALSRPDNIRDECKELSRKQMCTDLAAELCHIIEEATAKLCEPGAPEAGAPEQSASIH